MNGGAPLATPLRALRRPPTLIDDVAIAPKLAAAVGGLTEPLPLEHERAKGQEARRDHAIDALARPFEPGEERHGRNGIADEQQAVVGVSALVPHVPSGC